jgi:hypothetical protein
MENHVAMVRRLSGAEALFRGIIALDPTILTTTQKIIKTRNFARDEYGLPPDDNFGSNPVVVQRHYLGSEIQVA